MGFTDWGVVEWEFGVDVGSGMATTGVGQYRWVNSKLLLGFILKPLGFLAAQFNP